MKLKVGFIVDHGNLSSIIYDLIEKSIKSDSYSIDFLIVQKINFNSTSKFKKYTNSKLIYKTIESIFFSLIFKIEKKSLKKYDVYKKYFYTYDLNNFNIPIVEVIPIISKSGFIYKYNNEDLDKIKSLNLDVLLRGGSGILQGEILNLCKFGILSIHHGDNDDNRGGPPGFWEVYYRKPSTGFIIQKLQSQLDGGDVFTKGSITTSPSYVMNLVRISKIANVYFDKLLNKIGSENSLPAILPKAPFSYELFKLPSIVIQIQYLLKIFIFKISSIILDKRKIKVRWSVAYTINDNWKNVELRKLRKIKNPPNRFFADPFVHTKNGMHVCFVEDYNYKSSKGNICAIELTSKGYREIGTVLDESFHLSYPFLFSNKDELFMCPETHLKNEIRIYKCIDFPLRWEYHKTIMKNISASDSNLFYFNSKWWLLTNIDSAGIGDHNSELHLFYADSFDSSSWIPHPLNPIIFSPLKARNGGFIYNDNDIFRVFQVQGFNNYGESMGLAKITELSETKYNEEVLFNISPNFFKKIKGTHTFSSSSNIIALDYNKIEKTNI